MLIRIKLQDDISVCCLNFPPQQIISFARLFHLLVIRMEKSLKTKVFEVADANLSLKR